MVLFIILSLLVGVLGLIYYVLTSNLNYWTLRGVPHKKPLIFFGNLKDRLLQRKSFHETQKEFYFMFKQHPYFGMFEGRKPMLQVNHPDLLKNIMIKDFDHFIDRTAVNFKAVEPYTEKMLLVLKGGEWKQVRAALTPAFSSGKLKAMVPIENDCGVHLTDYIYEKIKENGGINADLDMKETLGKFTLDVIATTAFGVELDSHSNPDSEFAKQVARFNDLSKTTRFFVLATIFMAFPKCITRFIPISFFNLETIEFLTLTIKDATKKRKENNIRRNDFLQLLIDSQSGALSDDNQTEGETKIEKGTTLSENVTIAQAILFFIAGYETSGTLLTMMSYELAKNQIIQEKVRDEISNKLKGIDLSKGELTYEMINDMPYLDMVVAETLRMYPPVARLDRVCVKKYKLGDLELNPGDKIGVSAFGIHHDPDYYPEPNEFRPERFTAEEKAKRPSCTYLPFGVGPRNCIGLRLAQLSTKICIIHVLKNFEVEICKKTIIPFEFSKTSMLLKPKEGVVLRLSKLVV